MNRRHFITQTAALGALVGTGRAFATPLPLAAKAEHCIFLWLGGGMSQIDTFDPKEQGNAKSVPSRPGTDYDVIDTAVPGVKFTQHLPRLAGLADRLTAIRSVHHALGSEHALATNYVHTGRPVSGSTTYPSIGSIIAHERRALSEDMPAYVLIGYPSISRGPGFLGGKHGYVYLTDTAAGPAGFTPPSHLAPQRLQQRVALLQELTQTEGANSAVGEYADVQTEAFRLSGERTRRHYRVTEEPAALRGRYGSEFGQRCLLARRLVERGVRFVEVSQNLNFINGAGWDTHNAAHLKQHLLIDELDVAMSALIEDLRDRQLLEKTLIVAATEFGRPGAFDSGGGRGHQASVFTMLLAGGGLRHCGAWGSTDRFSERPVEDPVTIPDFHATILAALGIDPRKELVNAARPVPVTDGGRPIAALFG
jgi:hypothetical protein